MEISIQKFRNGNFNIDHGNGNCFCCILIIMGSCNNNEIIFSCQSNVAQSLNWTLWSKLELTHDFWSLSIQAKMPKTPLGRNWHKMKMALCNFGIFDQLHFVYSYPLYTSLSHKVDPPINFSNSVLILFIYLFIYFQRFDVRVGES